MTARQIANRLDQVELIIGKDERQNKHTAEYMEKIFAEEKRLREALLFELA